MNIDWQKIFESKRALRKNLAERPIVEKLRVLDAMRERELAIRSSRQVTVPEPTALKETPSLFKRKTGEGK